MRRAIALHPYRFAGGRLRAVHGAPAECRRGDYNRFKALWQSCHGGEVSADIMDLQLHTERGGGRRKRTYRARLNELPDGTFIALDGSAWLLWQGHLHAWSGTQGTPNAVRYAVCARSKY